MLTAALFTITDTQKQPKCLLTDEWIKKDVVYIQWDISHKKEWNNDICSSTNGPRDYHTKWNKSDKEIYNITYMWN